MLSADLITYTVTAFSASIDYIGAGFNVKFSGTGNTIATSKAYPYNGASEVGVVIWGNFTGTVTMETSPDGGTTWVVLPAKSGSVSSTGANVALSAWVFGQLIRARMSGGNPSDTWNVSVFSPNW